MSAAMIGVPVGFFSRARMVHYSDTDRESTWMIIVERARDKASFWVGFTVLDPKQWPSMPHSRDVQMREYIESKMVMCFSQLEIVQRREPIGRVEASRGMFNEKPLFAEPCSGECAWLEPIIREQFEKMAAQYGCKTS